MVHEVGAFHRGPAHAPRAAVGGEALAVPAHGVAGGLAFQLFGQLGLSFLPFFRFLHGDGQSLVHVVAAVARLCRLVLLGLLDDLAEVSAGRTVLKSEIVVVQLRQDREAVGHLDVGVAPERRRLCRVGAVEVGVVDGAPESAQCASLALDRQAHVFRQALADQHGGVGHLLLWLRKACLALCRIAGISAVGQGQTLCVCCQEGCLPLLCFSLQPFGLDGGGLGPQGLCGVRRLLLLDRLWQVDVVLLVLLQGLEPWVQWGGGCVGGVVGCVGVGVGGGGGAITPGARGHDKHGRRGRVRAGWGWGLRVGVEQLHGHEKRGAWGAGMYAEREGRMGGERVRGWWG